MKSPDHERVSVVDEAYADERFSCPFAGPKGLDKEKLMRGSASLAGSKEEIEILTAKRNK